MGVDVVSEHNRVVGVADEYMIAAAFLLLPPPRGKVGMGVNVWSSDSDFMQLKALTPTLTLPLSGGGNVFTKHCENVP